MRRRSARTASCISNRTCRHGSVISFSVAMSPTADWPGPTNGPVLKSTCEDLPPGLTGWNWRGLILSPLRTNGPVYGGPRLTPASLRVAESVLDFMVAVPARLKEFRPAPACWMPCSPADGSRHFAPPALALSCSHHSSPLLKSPYGPGLASRPRLWLRCGRSLSAFPARESHAP